MPHSYYTDDHSVTALYTFTITFHYTAVHTHTVLHTSPSHDYI